MIRFVVQDFSRPCLPRFAVIDSHANAIAGIFATREAAEKSAQALNAPS